MAPITGNRPPSFSPFATSALALRGPPPARAPEIARTPLDVTTSLQRLLPSGFGGARPTAVTVPTRLPSPVTRAIGGASSLSPQEPTLRTAASQPSTAQLETGARVTTPPLQARFEQALRALQEAMAQLMALVGQGQLELVDRTSPRGGGTSAPSPQPPPSTTTPALPTAPSTGPTTPTTPSTPGPSTTPSGVTAADVLKLLSPPGAAVPAQFIQRLDTLARSASPSALQAHGPELAAIGKHLVMTTGSAEAMRLGLDYRDPDVRARCDRSAFEQNLAVQSDVLVAVERTLAAPAPAPGSAQGTFTGATLARTLGIPPNDADVYRSLDLAALDLNRVADPAARQAIVQQLGALARSWASERVTGESLARMTGANYGDPEIKAEFDARALERNGALQRAFLSDLRAAVVAPPPTVAQGGPARASDLAGLLGLAQRVGTGPEVRHQLEGLAARAGNGMNVRAHAVALQELARARGQPTTGASVAARLGLDYQNPEVRLQANLLAAQENASADRGLFNAARQLLGTPATSPTAGAAPSPSGSELARSLGLDAANPAVRRALDTAAVLLKDSAGDPTTRDARLQQLRAFASSMGGAVFSGRAEAQRAGLDYSDPETKRRMDGLAATKQLAWSDALLQGVLDAFASPVPTAAQGGPASGRQLAEALGMGSTFAVDPELNRALTALALRAGSVANLSAHTSELRAVGQTLRTVSGAELARAAGEDQAYASNPEVRERYNLQAATANEEAREAVLRSARRILETPLPAASGAAPQVQPRPVAPQLRTLPSPQVTGAPQFGITAQQALFAAVGRVTSAQQAISIQRLSLGRV